MSLLVLFMAATVGAADQPPVKKAPDPNRVVCRDEPDTGSRFNKRTCMTQAQWDDRTAKAEELQRVNSQRAGLGVTQSAPGP